MKRNLLKLSSHQVQLSIKEEYPRQSQIKSVLTKCKTAFAIVGLHSENLVCIVLQTRFDFVDQKDRSRRVELKYNNVNHYNFVTQPVEFNIRIIRVQKLTQNNCFILYTFDCNHGTVKTIGRNQSACMRVALNPSLSAGCAVCMSRGGTHKNAHLNNSRIKPFWKHSQHTRTGTRVVTCREF